MNKLFKRTIIEAESSDLNLNEIVGGVGPDYCMCNNNPLSFGCPIHITCPDYKVPICTCDAEWGACNLYNVRP